MLGVEAFLHLPPLVLQASCLFEETGIHRSKPHSPSSSKHPTEGPAKNHSSMAGRRNSSARSPCPKPGDWEECSAPHSRLIELQTQGFLPPAFMVSVRAGIATYNGGEQAKGSPNPSPEERICLISHLLRGVGFPIHPYLRWLLEFHDLQLNNLTPASVLHIAGYVTLCELFLGCEAHFGLWKKLFCLVPRNQGESLCQVGGAEVWRIAETGYLSGTPKKASEDWPSEWFYVDDVPRIQSGQVFLSSVMPHRRHAEVGALRAPRRRIPEKYTS